MSLRNPFNAQTNSRRNSSWDLSASSITFQLYMPESIKRHQYSFNPKHHSTLLRKNAFNSGADDAAGLMIADTLRQTSARSIRQCAMPTIASVSDRLPTGR